MSVVNRMLLDIDKRHGAADVQTKGPYPDIRSVRPAAQPAARNHRVVILLAVVALAIAIAVVLNFTGRPDSVASPAAKAPLPVVARAATPAEVTPAPAAPVVQPVASEPTPAPVAATVSPPAPPEAAPAPELPREAAPKVSRPRAAPASIESFKLSRQLSPVEERPAATALPSPPNRVAGLVPSVALKAPPPQRQVAADETVAAARALWNDGARAGALATLGEALAVGEGARNPAVVIPIARELARLQVADNRPQAAVELLRRLEGILADDAEAWALRGNAEQRLALHADSAKSYVAALRLRPAEGRWMLGAAISLAADGRLDEATAWAERARDRGVVTPAIESYLQQLGVVARR